MMPALERLELRLSPDVILAASVSLPSLTRLCLVGHNSIAALNAHRLPALPFMTGLAELVVHRHGGADRVLLNLSGLTASAANTRGDLSSVAHGLCPASPASAFPAAER